MSKPKLYYSREEMQKLNTDKLLERGVTIEEIAKIAYKQQYRYNKDMLNLNAIILYRYRQCRTRKRESGFRDEPTCVWNITCCSDLCSFPQ